MFATLGDGGAEPRENKMTTKTLTGIVLAAVQPARATETGNLGIRVLPPRQRNKGFATGFALAFILVITLGGTWEVMGAERPRVEFSNPALQESGDSIHVSRSGPNETSKPLTPGPPTHGHAESNFLSVKGFLAVSSPSRPDNHTPAICPAGAFGRNSRPAST